MKNMWRYLQYVRPYKWKIIWTIIIGLLKFALPLTIPLFIKYVIDDVVSNKALTEAAKWEKLWQATALMLVLFVIIRPFIEYYRQYYAQWAASRILYDLRSDLFQHMQKLSMRYYANHRSGEMISRVMNDVEQTRNFILTGLMNLWLDAATIVIAIAIMLTLSVKLTIVSLISFPIYILSVKVFFNKLRQLTRDRSQKLGELQAFLQERVHGMTVIKSFAIEDEEHARFQQQNGKFWQKSLEHTSWNAKSFSAVNTVTDLAPIVVIAFSGYVVMQGNMTLGAMIAFIGYMDRLYNPLRRLVSSSTTLTQSLASMDRVFEFLDEPYDIEDGPNAIPIQEAKGKIELSNVTFRYEQQNVLTNVSLTIEAGKRIALVGMSGGGKSTLLNLLPRFYDVNEGAILLDGRDIRDYTVKSLRQQMGLVMQETILFSDSVKENIRYAKPGATDEEIEIAAQRAHAHDFIVQLPNGYDTPVGERGVKLSGGQKQRIALARVFLKNPPIFLLDEATSALDLESERYVQEALEKLASGRTTIIVAHRLSTITNADEIIVVDHGQIVERGSHAQLMAQQGAYYELYTIQKLESEQ